MVEHGLSSRANNGYLVDTLLFNERKAVIAFVTEQLQLRDGVRPDLSNGEAIGVVLDDKLVAGVVFHDYRLTLGHCYLSIAATTPKWATRKRITLLLSYPFIQLDCRRIQSMVRSDNARAIKFNQRLGFEMEGLQRDYYGEGVHNVLFGMMREDWGDGPYSGLRYVETR